MAACGLEDRPVRIRVAPKVDAGVMDQTQQLATPAGAGLLISVVLATYHRAETLRRTLRHLAEQDLHASQYEVIVIDDGSPDDTGAVVASMRTEMACALTYLRHDNHGPGYTQNRGIKAARAALVLLLADDIFLSVQALRAHAEHHRAHPAPQVVVMGKILQSPDLDQSVFLRKWDPFRFIEVDDQDTLPICRFGAPNVSAKRDFLLSHGPFLEHRGRAGAAAFEDVELGYRLHSHGMRLLYSKAALGYHHHVSTLDQAVNRWYERGLNYGEFRRHARHPELSVYFHVLNRDTVREYLGVLCGPNPFRGLEGSIAWHLFRNACRIVTLNGFTTRWVWRPVFDYAERWPLLAALVKPKMYRAYLYYHFLRGVNHGRSRYGA